MGERGPQVAHTCPMHPRIHRYALKARCPACLSALCERWHTLDPLRSFLLSPPHLFLIHISLAPSCLTRSSLTHSFLRPSLSPHSFSLHFLSSSLPSPFLPRSLRSLRSLPPSLPPTLTNVSITQRYLTPPSAHCLPHIRPPSSRLLSSLMLALRTPLLISYLSPPFCLPPHHTSGL